MGRWKDHSLRLNFNVWFQETEAHKNRSKAMNTTTFLAAKILLEHNFSTPTPNMQTIKNGTFLLSENHTHSYAHLVELNNTAPYDSNGKSHQSQCWETYVGQVCLILSQAVFFFHWWHQNWRNVWHEDQRRPIFPSLLLLLLLFLKYQGPCFSKK